MGSMNTWILSMQVFLISAGAVSIAMIILFTVPTAVNEVLVIWSNALSWLKPPYLLILINGIIITIAASSRFRQGQPSEPPPVQSQRLVSVRTPPPAYFEAFPAQPEVRTIVEVPQAADDGGDRVVELRPVVVNGAEVDTDAEEETVDDGEAEAEDEVAFLDWPTTTYNTPPPDTFSPEFQLEYYLPVKPIREYIPKREEARYETLESTWKKIMEGASRAATREEVRHVGPPPRPSPDRFLDNVCFRERTVKDDSPPSRASSGIQKQTSPSQDELNRRVEAFIKKVNGEMRLRRRESLNQHLEIINSGV